MSQSTSFFIQCMDRQTNLQEGENGALEHITTNESQIDLFFALVRNLPEYRLNELFEIAINNAHDEESKTNLFVLLFQTRNCRGGKGEKMLFYLMFQKMYMLFPRTALDLLTLIPHYGYFKDYFKILELSSNLNNEDEIVETIITIIANQLQKDIDALDDFLLLRKTEESFESKTELKLSLCAKHAPSEGKHFATGPNKIFFNRLVNKLFPYDPTDRTAMTGSRKHYRVLLSRLRTVLSVPEVFMCAQKYEEIDFSKVPSLCMNRHRKAFLNEIVSPLPKNHKKHKDVSCHDENGNRKPNDPGRVAARHNLINLTKAVLEGNASAKICGKQLMPHELVSQLMNKNFSSAESDLYDAQWMAIKKDVLASFDKEGQDRSLSLGKMIPLIDVSSSMKGTPMTVAIALGILVTEVTHPTFRDRFITFHEKPSWCNLSGCKSLNEKVARSANADWGGSTNFIAAFELILQVAVDTKLPTCEMPDSLIVFSDMQFNEAVNNKSTTFDLMKTRFADEGYTLPKIIFWNLRGDTCGFPVTADTDNVQMLSGFSPSLLKLILDGDPIEQSSVEDKPLVSPAETYCKAIYDKLYDPIREVIRLSDIIS